MFSPYEPAFPDEIFSAILQALHPIGLHKAKQVSSSFYSIINGQHFRKNMAKTILQHYFPRSRTNLVTTLKKQWPKETDKHLPELLFLILIGNNEVIKEKIKLGDLYSNDISELTLCDWACKLDNIDFLHLVYEVLIIPQYRSQDGETIDLRQTDAGGFTLLHWAILCRLPLAQIKLLKNLGYSLTAITLSGDTVLHIAARANHCEALEWLLNEKLEANAKRNNGATPLLLAAFYGHKEVSKLLLDHSKVDISATHNNSTHVLIIAAIKGHNELIKLLLADKRIDINAPCVDGHTALFMAAQNGHLTTVQLLLNDDRVNINAVRTDGTTALLAAAYRADTAMVELLVADSRINVDATYANGATSLIFAVKAGYSEIVDCLLKHNASILAEIKLQTKYLLSFAKKHNNKTAIEVFLKTQYLDQLPGTVSINSLEVAIITGQNNLSLRLLEKEKELPETKMIRALELAKATHNYLLIDALEEILQHRERSNFHAISSSHFFTLAHSEITSLATQQLSGPE
jgi:ankyrin repeat protein